MKRKSNLILLCMTALTLLAGPAWAAIWYVDGTTSGDGTSWAEGFETIAEAIADANAPDEIWVKAGTYTIPSQLEVNEAIGIYGGFAGDEIERSQRDWVNNATTIDGQDSVGIFYISDEPTIDGFTLTNGRNSVVWGGGAMYIASSDKTPRISNCIISNNTAYADPIGTEGFKGGGAIYVGDGAPIFTNCLITNNNTNAYGGGVNLYSGSPEFINCTTSKNSALKGGGVYLQGVGTILEAQFYNCIVWGNTGTSDANEVKVKVGGDEPQGNNNCCSVQIGTGTIIGNPLFMDAGNGNFRLRASSACIDAGDSTSVPADTVDLDGDGDPNEPVPWDLDTRPRFIDDPNTADTGSGPAPIVDIGAYEYGAYCGDPEHPYPVGDVNKDCGVDFVDFATCALAWLTSEGEAGWNPECNLHAADLTIDTLDLDVLVEHWLECTKLECD